MATASPAQHAGARNSAQVLLQAIASQPLAVLAEVLGVDESVACRVRSGDARVTLHQACALIDALQKKLVNRDQVCVDRAKYEAMATLFAAAMADAETARKLIWEDQ